MPIYLAEMKLRFQKWRAKSKYISEGGCLFEILAIFRRPAIFWRGFVLISKSQFDVPKKIKKDSVFTGSLTIFWGCIISCESLKILKFSQA